MKSTKRDYLGLLCSIYLIILLAVVPLYMEGSYYKLGDAKYLLFRNVSFLCLGIWLVLEACSLLHTLFRTVVKISVQEKRNGSTGINTVDIFVLSYGFCVLLSAVMSDYSVAWGGYRDWYMGAVSQMLFVWIYFFVSRYYERSVISVYGAEGAFFVVVLIGLLNRLGVDVFGVFRNMTEQDWEYSHMLSTVGNINWFCGYCSVMLGLPIVGYLYSRTKCKGIALYVVSVLGLVLLFIQGSDSGPVLVAVAIGVCLLAGVKKPEFFRRGLLLLAGMCVGIFVMRGLIVLTGAQSATPVDGGIYEKMCWSGWLPLALITWGISFLVSGSVKKLGDKGTSKWLGIVTGVLLLVTATLAVFFVLEWMGESLETWGSGRGLLWKLGWEGFLQADLWGKLFGAGPDCFAEYLGAMGTPPIITKEGHWAYAVFANAHNEWLNHLINLGIFGTGCYLGIFLCAVKRYRGMLLGIMVLSLYSVHSLVSFQQVLNTPLLFALLGICESQYRRQQAQ